MPIRPEMRDRYPKNWSWIRARILNRAQYKCEWCGVPNGAIGGRRFNGVFLHAAVINCSGKLPALGSYSWCIDPDGQNEVLRIIRIVLTVAHVHNHDPEDCRDENLAALCQRCHNRHDVEHRRRGIRERHRRAVAIGDLFA